MTDNPMLRTAPRCVNPTVTRGRRAWLDQARPAEKPAAEPAAEAAAEPAVRPGPAWNMAVVESADSKEVAVVGLCAMWPAVLVVPLT